MTVLTTDIFLILYYLESKWSTLRKTMERYSRNIYFFIARLFLFDAWLLSQFTGVRRWLQEKTPKILWIALIPLLLLGESTYISCVAQEITYQIKIKKKRERELKEQLWTLRFTDLYDI